MKLATYRAKRRDQRSARWTRRGARVFDLAAAAVAAGAATRALRFDAEPDRRRTTRGSTWRAGFFDKHGGEADLWLQLAGVELLAPLPEPRQMRDGMSFATHIRQSARGAAGRSRR